MKKFVVLLLILFVVTGCGNLENKKEVEKIYSIKYNDDIYNVYMPYKKNVSENYIIDSNVTNFDIEKIERDLIQISTNEFDIKKYYYQEGQYLSKKHLKKLLSEDYLNDSSEKNIDGKKIKPVVISGIFEKNFVNKKGTIKGMSLGIILNKYQTYDSKNNYVTMNEKDVIAVGKKSSSKLIKYIREEFNLKDLPILVALYVEASPSSSFGGNYLYYGVTTGDDIKFNYIKQKNYYMTDQSVKEFDNVNYNKFKKFKEAISEVDASIQISGLGYYNGDNLTKLDIVLIKSNYRYGELLYINQLLSENSIKYFDNVKVDIKVTSMNDVKSHIVKEQKETTTDIFIY